MLPSIVIFSCLSLSFISFGGNCFPFCEARLSFSGRVSRFSCKSITADIWEDKASVQSEGEDGIPKFWRQEKICGRLSASTPTASVAALDVPPGRSNFAWKNATLPRLNHHKGIVTDLDLLDFRYRGIFVLSWYSIQTRFHGKALTLKTLKSSRRQTSMSLACMPSFGYAGTVIKRIG